MGDPAPVNKGESNGGRHPHVNSGLHIYVYICHRHTHMPPCMHLCIINLKNKVEERNQGWTDIEGVKQNFGGSVAGEKRYLYKA